MEGLTIEKIAITVEACAAVIETALEAGHTHGIGYWARVERTKNFTTPDEPNKERIGWIELIDHQGAGAADATADSAYAQMRKLYPSTKPGIVSINTDNIKRAIEKILCDEKDAAAEGWAARIINQEYADGPQADVIVQVACFGRVIYA